jgi:hypothetical protein
MTAEARLLGPSRDQLPVGARQPTRTPSTKAVILRIPRHIALRRPLLSCNHVQGHEIPVGVAADVDYALEPRRRSSRSPAKHRDIRCRQHVRLCDTQLQDRDPRCAGAAGRRPRQAQCRV